jgi:hypothetical protein
MINVRTNSFDIEAKATYQNSPRNRINKKTGSMIKNQ